MHTRRISDYGGVANTMPWLAAFWILFSMANSGLPGTSGFVGEFMIILASFQQHPLIAFAAATTLMIGAGYSLWLAKRVIWGDVGNAHVAELKDINMREWIVLGVFRSEEHTSELQSLMRISYAVFCLKKKNKIYKIDTNSRRKIQ